MATTIRIIGFVLALQLSVLLIDVYKNYLNGTLPDPDHIYLWIPLVLLLGAAIHMATYPEEWNKKRRK